MNPLMSRELQNRIDTRKRFGLNADPNYVASVTGPSNFSVGVPITPDEATQLAHRDAAGQQIVTIDRTESAKHPETYAGTWMDNQAGGEVVVNTTDARTIDLAYIQSLLPSDINARIQKVAVSSVFLAHLHSRIEHDARFLPALKGAGFGTFIEDNQEVLDLGSGATQSDVDALYARYGKAGLRINLGRSGRLL